MYIRYQPTTIDYANRAVSYGDGCFTTAVWQDNTLQLKKEHLARLQQGCDQLHIVGFAPTTLESYLDEHVIPQLTHDCVIKILVSIAAGGRGYQRPESPNIDVYITQHPMPKHYQMWQQQGVKLGVSSMPLAKQPKLAGIKHLNRLEQVLVKNQCLGNVDDLIVLDSDGMMVEVSSANIFWRFGQQWYTPELYYCGVAGVVRGKILETQQRTLPVSVVRAKPSVLLRADEVFICNSVMGLVPVNKICLNEQQSIDFDMVSSYFQQLNDCL
ncbi:aminodeoxychorismate lyase [Alteromonas sp. a30]|uniref:aminodeoxychorismate lyase n=1 Tax=Alteromonas sp. a30 TaxID=2730917 RepID=UPI002281194B|nr:aminodeoxychorismate lyase [Alteromonas sp. a30]MCY7294060.1 aminodeoxychorismate lyase [Alteromonas sp. a30]